MTLDQLVDETFVREGDTYGDETTTPPIDQPTAPGGLTLPVVREYCRAHGLPLPTVDTLKTMTRDTARAIVRWKLETIARGAGLDAIAFEPLRVQMVDFAYNSGAPLALRWLQRVLRVDRTGRMDAATVAALERSDQWLVHHALMGARLQMLDMATDPGGKVSRAFEEGLENRALGFSLLAIP